MLLWVVFAVLTALAIAIIAAPLVRGVRASDLTGTTPDIEVYKAQLNELDRDVDRGVISVAEAESARIEVSRRLLAEEERAAKIAGAVTAGPGRAGMIGVVILVPVLAAFIYVNLGSPQLPGQPMVARIADNPETQDIRLLVARVETHLADNPEDGRGWAVVAPVYRRLGRYDDAARAFANVIRLSGTSAELEADHGEMLVAADDGVVNSAAREAFERAVALDASAIKPRFFLAMALGQDGSNDAAIAAWTDLLNTPGDPDATWRARAREQLAGLGADVPDAPAQQPGPTREQMAAAQDMSQADRQAMIEGMVSGLAERLSEGEGDIDDWLRLIRAYSVLGRPDDAVAAAQTARERFASDSAALGRIDAATRQVDNGS